MEKYFQKIPNEELIENKQSARSKKKKELDQAEKAGKEEEE